MGEDIRELIVEDDLFDPFDEEGEEPEPDEQPLIGAPLDDEQAEKLPVLDLRTPRQRIEDLMEQMPGQRRTILRMIDYCREERSVSEMDERYAQLHEYSYSVYSAVIFRELLEEAGAIRYIPAEGEIGQEAASGSAKGSEGVEGNPAKAAAQPEGVVREVYFDGEEEVEFEFLEIADNPAGTWVATEDGLTVVDAQDDFKKVQDLLGKEPQYLPVYRQILDYCRESARSAKDVDALVANEPLLQEPRRFAGYFIGRLEREGALEWRGGWIATDVGCAILTSIAA